MEKEKKNIQKIDEEYVMSLMAGGVRKEGMQPASEPVNRVEKQEDKEPARDKPLIKEKTKAKKSLDESYGDLFLNSHTMTKRGDKSIYIRPEYHERLSRIVRVVGQDQIPLYAYLDNILQHHFNLFEKAIIDDFNEKYKPIF